MAGRGRPRLTASPTGRGTRSDLLASAAQLFARDGFRASTHAIAEGAGVRQATLYHHFANREELLLTLLLQTVQPTLAIARQLLDSDAPGPRRLWALAYWDVRQLATGKANPGALYLLPETTKAEYAQFQAEWQALRECYRELVEACGGTDPAATDLALGLVESTILARRRAIGQPDPSVSGVSGASGTSSVSGTAGTPGMSGMPGTHGMPALQPPTVPAPDAVADAVILLVTGRPIDDSERAASQALAAALPS